MGINIGLDIGAISLKLAALGKSRGPAHPRVPLLRPSRVPHACPGRSGRWFSPITGASPAAPSNPPTTCCASSTTPSRSDRVEGMRVTGSGSRTIAKVLGLFFENEFKAIARMIGDVLSAGAHGFRDRRRKLQVHPPGGRQYRGLRPLRRMRRRHRLLSGPAGPAHAVLSGGRGRSGVHRQLRRAHRRPLLRVRQKRHDPRPAEGLFAGRNPARPLRRGGAQLSRAPS